MFKDLANWYEINVSMKALLVDMYKIVWSQMFNVVVYVAIIYVGPLCLSLYKTIPVTIVIIN